MTIDLSRMNALEWAMWIIPLIVLGAGAGGIVRQGWAFTSSLYWRVACFGLALLPLGLGVGTYCLCKLIGYDNGRAEAFHPDAFAFGCFAIMTPVYVLLALVFSIFARGVRIGALALNLCLGMLWFVALMNIRM